MPRTVAKNEDGSKDLTAYVGKPVTPAVQQYFEWLKERTGYAKLDLTSVKLAKTLGAEFQTDMRENGSPRARNATGQAAPKPAPKPAAKKTPAAAAPKSKPAPAKPAAKTPAPKPAATTRRGAAAAEKAPASKPATTPRTGRRGKPANDSPAAAPY
jgi:translation initiation factor IF-2